MNEDFAKLFVLSDGKKILGFPRDFVRTSVRATIRFPLAHGPISMAIGPLLITAFRNGRQAQVQSLIYDLQSGNPSQINLEAVSSFVHRKYQSIGFDYERISEDKFAKMFLRQISFGARVIIAGATEMLIRYDGPVSDYIKNFGRYGEEQQLDLALERYALGLELLSENELDFLGGLFSAIYQEAEDDEELKGYVSQMISDVTSARDSSIPLKVVTAAYRQKIGPRMEIITNAATKRYAAQA